VKSRGANIRRQMREEESDRRDADNPSEWADLSAVSILIRRHFDLHPPRRANTSEDEIDPGEKILSVVVSPHRPGHAAREWELLRIKLRPRSRHRFQEIASVEALRPGELPIGRIPPGDAQDIVQQRGYGDPVFPFRHAKGSNLLANAFNNENHGRLPRGSREGRTNPRMSVDGVEHGQREPANVRLRLRAGRSRSQGVVQGASDNDIARGGHQIAPVGDVPINGTGAGREPFGQGAKGETAFSTTVQELDRRFDDLFP
jgi:hypothetical protein